MREADKGLARSWELHLRSLGRSPRTIELYLDVLGRFSDTQDGLLTVTKGSATAYLAGLRDRGLKENTVRSRWVALRSFYRWAVDEEEIAASPLDKVRVPKPTEPPPDVLGDDDLAALLATCKGREFKSRRDLAILRILAGTGLRVTECAEMRDGDLDLARRLLVVRRGKGGKVRTVRIDPATAAALDRYLRVRSRHRCANLPDLWIGHRGRFGVQGIREVVAQRAREAGLGHVHPHQLRHTYAHRWLARGGNEGDLQMLGGWEGPTVMRRYGSALAADRALAAADDIDVLGGL
ncbi:MAG: hypothetical protein FJW88_12770 [Actinobacteria bacterium]|nr:hypothetical protein [Actinomycetota bacterium]